MKHLLFAVMVLFVFQVKSAHAASNGRGTDWQDMFQACSEDWDRYEKLLRQNRETFQKDLRSLSQNEYLARYKKDDAMVFFIALHWPSDLSDKDKSWGFYKECSDLNWEVRKLMSSSGTDEKANRKAVHDLRNCLVKNYPKDMPLVYQDLMTCYEKRTAAPKSSGTKQQSMR